jgi:methionyl-tRNA formyltransferase
LARPNTNPSLRVVILGHRGSPLTEAAVLSVRASPRAVLTATVHGRATVGEIRSKTPDIVVVAGYHYRVGPVMRAVARVATVGLHPSLLPAYRGSYPLWWALRNGESKVGLTLYLLDDGIDTGPIISQASITVRPRDTFASLYRRVVEHAPELIVPALSDFAEVRDLPPTRAQPVTDAKFYRTPSLGARVLMKARWEIRRLVGLVPRPRGHR